MYCILQETYTTTIFYNPIIAEFLEISLCYSTVVKVLITEKDKGQYIIIYGKM